MIKGKIISLVMAGVVGVGGVVITTLNWNGSKALNSSSTSVANYVTQTNYAMVKSKNIINNQNKEIEKLKQENSSLSGKVHNLNNQLSQENQMVESLNKVIATLQGDSDYKNMSVTEKRKTLNNLLKDWGYGKMSISIADKIFSWTDGWGFARASNKNSNESNISSSNNRNTNNKVV